MKEQAGWRESATEGRADEFIIDAWKHVAADRILLCEYACHDEQWRYDYLPPCTHRVPKKLPDRTISTKGRFIQDFRPKNQGIPKEAYKKPDLPTLADVIMDYFHICPGSMPRFRYQARHRFRLQAH